MANPFMVTSNECYGMSLPKASERASYLSPGENPGDAPGGPNAGGGAGTEATPADASSPPATPHDLSFLYSRESDRFGEGAQFSDSSLSRVFRLAESDPMSKRRKNSVFVRGQGMALPAPNIVRSKEEVQELLSQYNHNPKDQNSLYSTTANEYGRKKPSLATYPTARHGNTQKFSQSFNRTMFRDEGLNSSMTRSKIHDFLTAQFV